MKTISTPLSVEEYMKLVDIDSAITSLSFFTLNRIYQIEYLPQDISIYIIYLLDDRGVKTTLSKSRFVPATEAEYHAQRGIRKAEKFNL